MAATSISIHTVILQQGKEKPVLNGHPWIFSGAIKDEPSQAKPGDLVEVLDHKKKFVARGFYNPKSQIRVRVLTRNETEIINEDFIATRIKKSIQRRLDHIDLTKTNSLRLVAHESDLLPGLVIDRYDQWYSFQILNAGMENFKNCIVSCLTSLHSPNSIGIIERSDEAIRLKEGLQERVEILANLPGKSVREVEFLENGMVFLADLERGHKTGFYLDQRDARACVRQFAKSARVLNTFSYSGGFSVAALHGGAMHVTNIDESQPALDLSRQIITKNGFDTEKTLANVRADAFQYLRQLRDQNQTFDLVVLDPPKFIASQGQMDRALRGYKDLNMLAMQLVRPGGYLATFSCSGLLARDLFQKVVFGASSDTKTEWQILHHLSQASDHPILLSYPESAYLKGLFMKKI
jgi:23S rRNA (cytosine1962-C5)-methyltransferase